MKKLKPGDKVVRVLPPCETFPAWAYPGRVIALEDRDRTVVCVIDADQPRTMRFAAKNGLATDGTGSFILPAETFSRLEG